LFTAAEVIKTAEQACDTIDSLSHEALDLNSDAVAYAIHLYASGKESLILGANGSRAVASRVSPCGAACVARRRRGAAR
jgi:hypothetical protein